ncbi:MAG: YbhB/YbcL family Raf kinase inhibitor-like protein, partial [Bacteroidia bacterium]
MIPAPIHISEELKTLQVSSDAFKDKTYIPIKYTCDGDDVNPPLTVHGIPEKAKSLVLIVEDPDSPKKVWTHWLVWNIPPSGKIKEKSIPGIEGKNDFEKQHYGG